MHTLIRTVHFNRDFSVYRVSARRIIIYFETNHTKSYDLYENARNVYYTIPAAAAFHFTLAAFCVTHKVTVRAVKS